MKAIVASILTGAVVYIMWPSLNWMIASLPHSFTLNQLVWKCIAIAVLWVLIYGILSCLSGKR